MDGFAVCVRNWLGSTGFVDAWFSYGEISTKLPGCLVLLDHPLSYVLNKNPPLVIPADNEPKALEHKDLPCMFRAALKEPPGEGPWDAAACWDSHRLSPLISTKHSIWWTPGEKNRHARPPETWKHPIPVSPFPEDKGTRAYRMCNSSVCIWQASQKAILPSLPWVSMPNPFILEW